MDSSSSLTPPRPPFHSRNRPSPPSAFPFQAYPGNPDPLPSAYGRRRVSLESLPYDSDASASTLPRAGSLTDLHKPALPFAAPLSTSSSSSSVYRASAAAPIASSLYPAQVFRPPFLSPASRPTSSLSWAPPVLDYDPSLHVSPSGSNLALPHHRPPLPSTKLEKGSYSKDPSTDSLQGPPLEAHKATKRHRPSCWVTLACVLLGIIGAAALCYTGVSDVKKQMFVESELCLIMDEDFSSSDLNDAYWTKQVQVDDLGFQINTDSSTNIYLQDNQLYIFPSLTSDDVPDYATDGQTYAVPGCTADVAAAAAAAPATSSNTTTSNTNTTSTSTSGSTSTVASASATASATHARRQTTASNSTSSNSTTTNSTSSNSTTTNSTSSTGDYNNATAQADTPAGTLCTAVTNSAAGTVINPVMSGRITTKGKVGIKYGRVEIIAKVASGDWLWPSVWMLPENDTYGAWPLSGEIDILETRGNSPSYPAQGTNYVRSALVYGLSDTLQPITVPGETAAPLTKDWFGWLGMKRTSYDKAWHTYAVEWDEAWMRFWVDGRVRSVLDVTVDQGMKKGGTFWEEGKFPATAQNKTTGSVVVVSNPWEAGTPAAPFDQSFYLNIDLGVGGTTGWFPDNVGGKPWYDGSNTAMVDFNKALDTWYQTWPQDPDDRAFRIKSVKMWSKGCSSATSR